MLHGRLAFMNEIQRDVFLIILQKKDYVNICKRLETELDADISVQEPIVKDVNGYKRRNTKTKREERIKDLPVREVPSTIPDDEQFCNQCGTPLKVLVGTQVIREELEYIPAKLRIVRYTQDVIDECKK